MRYRIFLSDFDGTLVRGDGTVSEANKAAIRRYREKGGIFAIVTGRMPASILPRLEELGIREGLAVAFQGATVADIKTRKLLKNGAFEKEAGLLALRTLERAAEHIHCYTADKLFCNVQDEPLEIYERICGVKAEVINTEPLSAFAERENLRVVKTLAMIEPEKCPALIQTLEAELGEEFYITRSAPFMVEVMPKGQNKGSAVEFLSKYYGVPISEIAAIGDQDNDIPMVSRAGGKFAVENADENLKKIAQVMPSVEDDGVKCALEIAMGEEE